MRVVTLEEHFFFPDMMDRVPQAKVQASGWPAAFPKAMQSRTLIADLAEARLAEMDDAGISMQILSWVGPGAELLDGPEGVDFAREANDRLAAVVARYPTRFGAFAQLPVNDPSASAEELERASRQLNFAGAMIYGLTAGKFLDHPSFSALLERAEALDIPLYVHPNQPPRAVFDAYYRGLDDNISYMLSTGAWGWHAETALHMLRLVLSGTLDKHRGLRLIVGHMGECLPAMMARFDQMLTRFTNGRLTRTVSQTLLDQLWITTSGFFDLPSFMAALLTFGADRMLFSVDYPFATMKEARSFLDRLPLSPVDREKIAFGNADRILGIKATMD